MKNRQEATEYILSMLDKIDPSGHNSRITKAELSKLSDEEFDKLMQDYADDRERPVVYEPNFGPVNLSVDRNIKIAREHFGYEFRQRLWIGSNDKDTPKYLTPISYLVLELPFRRQAQIGRKGISTTEHTRSIDQRTGQVAGDSAAAKVSYPELQILRGMGMFETAKELIKFRGGDLGGFDALNTMATREGEVSQAAIEQFSTGVESTKAMKTVLYCMHLSNTL